MISDEVKGPAWWVLPAPRSVWQWELAEVDGSRLGVNGSWKCGDGESGLPSGWHWMNRGGKKWMMEWVAGGVGTRQGRTWERVEIFVFIVLICLRICLANESLWHVDRLRIKKESWVRNRRSRERRGDVVLRGLEECGVMSDLWQEDVYLLLP